MLEEQTAE